MNILSRELKNNGQMRVTCYYDKTGERIVLVCPQGTGKKAILRAAWGAVKK